ncbi:TolC family protein [Synechococcus sp. CCY9202]|uniref:TolC family protein n=1 Tax=Synechococcus sp. CCY9202 TaxID=174698 RepID=UPI002B1FFA21|nr:TolC family protein [Synechococcus sp. CCY9202]MEA5424233.1 TolC family protein [Synechococcus sp. CCY9202]
MLVPVDRLMAPLAAALLAGVVLPAPAALAEATPPALRPLLRSFEAYARDLDRLDQAWPADAESAAPSPVETAELLRRLPAPAAGALPDEPSAVAIRERLRLDLQQAIALAVQNDPVLQQQIARVNEQQGWLRSVRGRFYPILGLALGGGYSQQAGSNWAWKGNLGVEGYGVNSAFAVPTGSSNRYQTNIGEGFAQLRLDYELVSFERSAALAQVKADLQESQHTYANRLRQLQLDVSEAYYRLQLADQLRRIRQVVVDNDTVIRDQVLAMKTAALVPRVDLLRAEALLQQDRFRLEQAEALRFSSQRRLSNLVNVPFDVTLVARQAVRLQPPWPLDLEQTIVRGFQDNPQLQALQAARTALQRQADRSAAELLPRVSLFATGGYQVAQSTSPVIDLNDCCKGPAFIPGLNSQGGDWAAGVLLNWRLFDAGITTGAVQATLAAADRTAQAEAAERNAIRQRLEAAYYGHRAALSQIIAANASFRAAREAYRDSRARYEFGLADYTDLADTIRSLTTAMEQRAEAMTLANLSYAQLLRELLPVPSRPDQPVELPITLPQ